MTGRAPLLDRSVQLAGAGLAPAIIYIAHFFYGAAVILPALILFACLFVVLAGTLMSPQARRGLDRLRPAWLAMGLFGAVLAVAAFTLTPWIPGSSHPIWAWSGGSPSSTLNRSATALEILKLAGLAAPFLIGCVSGARTDTGRRLYGLILGLGAIYAVVSLILFMSQAGESTSSLRLAGGFESANIAGSLFGALTVMSSAWGLRSWGRFARQSTADRVAALAPTAALVLLFLACLLLTASRGALGTTGFALALFAAWAALDNRRARWPLIVAGVVILSVAVVVYVQGNTLFIDRLEFLADGRTDRADLLVPHWQVFLDAPLFGSGLGSYPEVNNQIMTSANAQALSSTVVLHNVYVQWLEEAGIAGAAPMFLFIALILGVTASGTLHRSRNRVLIVGLLGASLILLLHATVDVGLNTPSICAFWSLLLGLGFGLSQASKRTA